MPLTESHQALPVCVLSGSVV